LDIGIFLPVYLKEKNWILALEIDKNLKQRLPNDVRILNSFSFGLQAANNKK